jgi:hypothetical protein
MNRELSAILMALTATAAMLLSGVARGDAPFRCGSKIITAGMTMADVRSYCGEPTTRKTEVVDVRAGPRVVGKTLRHTWTYESYSTGNRVLEFDEDRLVSIR